MIGKSYKRQRKRSRGLSGCQLGVKTATRDRRWQKFDYIADGVDDGAQREGTCEHAWKGSFCCRTPAQKTDIQ